MSLEAGLCPDSSRRNRRALLKLAAVGGGLAAALHLHGNVGAASGDSLLLGRVNDAGADQTTLTSHQGGNAALVVTNTAESGVGIRGTNIDGYGLWGVGGQGGVRGIGQDAGVVADANASTGIGVVGRRGARFGTVPTNTGVFGFASFGTGVIGEGGGATGIRGFAGQHDGTSSPVGVGVQGVGLVGVLAQAAGSGTGLRAIGPGKAVDAFGPVSVTGPTTLKGTTTVSGSTTLNGATTVNGATGVNGVLNVAGHVNATGTITGGGGIIGIVATSGPGGTALKAIGPSGGVAIKAAGDVEIDDDLAVAGDVRVDGDLAVGSDVRVNGDLAVAGAVTGNGSGLTSVRAESLTGTVSPDRVSVVFARRDKFNRFGKINEFRSIVRFNDRMISKAAGRATVAAGQTFVDVDLPSNIVLGAGSVIIATPQESLHGTGFFAKFVGPHRIRIALDVARIEAIDFGYLVIN